MSNKRDLSERDICSKYITPAITAAGWDLHEQIREEVYFTAGKIQVRGQRVLRGKGKRVDYILYHKPNIPLALIEAKDNKHSVGDGMQQALDYAQLLDIPFVYSSNGDAFLQNDRTKDTGSVETELTLGQFPSPAELWQQYKDYKGIRDEATEQVVAQDYHYVEGAKDPRYYQMVAINRTMEAIAQGRDRILLVMATGTGKTYVASQIIWRLWKSGAKKRILFLADRNILVDQAKVNDFKYFGEKMTKIRNRKVDKSYEFYLALYQGVSGSENFHNIYKQFSPGFFDLIVVDECHRGSAREDSAWHEILQYFSAATQIGMTATPKETKYISNIHYFGDPIYTYSLRNGIDDGFLAPYKVIRVMLDRDYGWRPLKGQVDDQGQEIPDRMYNSKDYDRDVVLPKRCKKVAERITEFLKHTDRFSKTIVFCEDIDHAERMRQALVNENSDLFRDNHRYIMRITGDEEIGKRELDNFIDPESSYPVVVTTSRLLSTGVDAQTCKLIVLDRNIGSMTEFKQIIGRGTRLRIDFDKYFFTIMDFRQVTNLFADPDFDGDPVMIYEPPPDGPILPEDEEIETEPPLDGDGEEVVIIDSGPFGPIIDPPSGRTKYVVGDVEVEMVAERVQYLDADGRLITESLKDYTRKNILKEYRSLEEFAQQWSAAEKKYTIIDRLQDQGVIFEELEKEVGQDMDPFDLICHVCFDQPPLTRKERAAKVRKSTYFTQYGEQVRQVLEALLDKYADEGIENIESLEALQIPPVNQIGTVTEIMRLFGGKDQYMEAIRDLESAIYTPNS